MPKNTGFQKSPGNPTLLGKTLDSRGYKDKELVVGVDNSYTNKEVLKHLPQRTTLVGRIRKDTKLYKLPEAQPGSGRKRVYGQRLPTPEEIRQSEHYQWQQVEAWAAGKKQNTLMLPRPKWYPKKDAKRLPAIY